ncbi:MAG: hypothetical protein ACXAD7_24755, partial [Candidatus Kariarchaeaceae archaeon]
MQKLNEQQGILKNLIADKTALEKDKQALEDKTELFDSERDELRDQLKMMQQMAIDSDENSVLPENEILKPISKLHHDIET